MNNFALFQMQKSLGKMNFILSKKRLLSRISTLTNAGSQPLKNTKMYFRN